jgi:hypothetical protein
MTSTERMRKYRARKHGPSILLRASFKNDIQMGRIPRIMGNDAADFDVPHSDDHDDFRR